MILPKNNHWQQQVLHDQTVRFKISRSARKSVGLRISDEGLIITAPTWASKAQITDALSRKANWILSKLNERTQRLNLQAMQETVWQHEGRLPFLGVPISLQLNPLLGETVFSGDETAPTNQDRLCLAIDINTDSQRVQDLCHIWLQRQAKRYLTARLQSFLMQCSYQDCFTTLRLASPAKRWGSCSSSGTIMLNWRLIHFAPAIIDYVVAHEVAHLKEMNHSPNFWQEVERLLPSFYTARQQLKQFDPTSLPLF